MLKSSLPWMAIAAILLVLFLLPQIPGKSPVGMTPNNAWDQGVALLTTERPSGSTREDQARELLRNTTSFAAPAAVDPALLVRLKAIPAEDDPHVRELQLALLDAAERLMPLPSK